MAPTKEIRDFFRPAGPAGAGRRRGQALDSIDHFPRPGDFLGRRSELRPSTRDSSSMLKRIFIEESDNEESNLSNEEYADDFQVNAPKFNATTITNELDNDQAYSGYKDLSYVAAKKSLFDEGDANRDIVHVGSDNDDDHEVEEAKGDFQLLAEHLNNNPNQLIKHLDNNSKLLTNYLESKPKLVTKYLNRHLLLLRRFLDEHDDFLRKYLRRRFGSSLRKIIEVDAAVAFSSSSAIHNAKPTPKAGHLEAKGAPQCCANRPNTGPLVYEDWERSRAIGGDGTYPYSVEEVAASRALVGGEGEPWRAFEGDACIKHMLDIRDEGNIKGEDRFRETSERLLILDDIKRSWIAVKNYWNRQGRKRSGFDERKKRNYPLATSKQGKGTRVGKAAEMMNTRIRTIGTSNITADTPNTSESCSKKHKVSEVTEDSSKRQKTTSPTTLPIATAEALLANDAEQLPVYEQDAVQFGNLLGELEPTVHNKAHELPPFDNDDFQLRIHPTNFGPAQAANVNEIPALDNGDFQSGTYQFGPAPTAAMPSYGQGGLQYDQSLAELDFNAALDSGFDYSFMYGDDGNLYSLF